MSFPPPFTVLIDTPMGSAGALAASLDAVERFGEAGRHAQVLVLLRGEDPNAIGVASRHRVEPRMLMLPAAGPVDPSGQIASAVVGKYSLCLAAGVTPDTDTTPWTTMRDHLDLHPQVAAVSGTVVRADGRVEAHPSDSSLHGGAVMLRNDPLLRVGGFSRLMDPGEGADFDLTCRLLRGKFGVERFDDLRFRREAGPADRTVYHPGALRDELIAVERFLPRAMRRRYRRDAVARARALTRSLGMTHELARAVAEARRWAQWERKRGRSELVGSAIEHVWGWGRTKRDVAAWASSHPIRRVAIAGWTFNLYAVYRSAHRAGLEVTAIADDHPMLRGASYRGVPVLPVRDAVSRGVDGVIIADESPATAEGLAQNVGACFDGPVLTRWSPRYLDVPLESGVVTTAQAA